MNKLKNYIFVVEIYVEKLYCVFKNYKNLLSTQLVILAHEKKHFKKMPQYAGPPGPVCRLFVNGE